MPLQYSPLGPPGAFGRGWRRVLSIMALLIASSACDDPGAEAYIQRAEAYRQKGEISASIIELKNALQQEPRNARARYLLGRNYLAIRDLASAEKELLRARTTRRPKPTIEPSSRPGPTASPFASRSRGARSSWARRSKRSLISTRC